MCIRLVVAGQSESRPLGGRRCFPGPPMPRCMCPSPGIHCHWAHERDDGFRVLGERAHPSVALSELAHPPVLLGSSTQARLLEWPPFLAVLRRSRGPPLVFPPSPDESGFAGARPAPFLKRTPEDYISLHYPMTPTKGSDLHLLSWLISG